VTVNATLNTSSRRIGATSRLLPKLGLYALGFLLSGCLLTACGGSDKEAITESTPTPARVLDPSSPGPYPVGVTEIIFEKTSVTTDEPRILKTVVWYPASANARNATLDEKVGGVRDAEPEHGQGPLPIVVWSHGAGGSYPYAPRYYASHLASYGFVVIAPPHPGNLHDECSSASGCTQEGMVDSYLNRPEDVTFALESMLKLSENPDSPFYRLLDGTRVGISGHSFGGNDTVRLAETEMGTPFSAALAMAPCTAEAVAPPDKVTMPLMIMAGDRDKRCLSTFEQTFFDGLSERLPHFFLVFPRGGHSAYGDTCPLPIPELACGPDDLSQEKAHQLILFYATAFFKTYVAKEEGYAAFLDPAVNSEDPDIRYTAVLP
jgi:dienelactone hydrolase